MRNLDALGKRTESELLKTCYGFETAYDEAKKEHCVKAVFETQAGQAVMLGSTELMALMMEHQMSAGRTGIPAAHRALLNAEYELVAQVHQKQQAPSLNTASFASTNPRRLVEYAYAVGNFPPRLQEQVRAYLQTHMLRPGAAP